MSILEKLEPFKRRYIDILSKDNVIHNISYNKFSLKDKRTLIFKKGDYGYHFLSINYLPSRLDSSDFIKVLKNDINYQINYLENIQKILWALMIYDEIPPIFFQILQMSSNGIRNVYKSGNDIFDQILKDKKPSNLFLKAVKHSKTSPLRVPNESLFSINFENSSDNKTLVENKLNIIPISLFSPKTNHEKIEYVEFLKNWAEFD